MSNDPSDNSAHPTNQINISSITGGVNNIGSQVENQTVVNNYGEDQNVSPGNVYEVIVGAIPAEDREAIEAARKLLELESTVQNRLATTGDGPTGAETDEALGSQMILVRYKPQIVAALQEMGLAWLQTAFPVVAFVRPLIKIALDAWNERQQ